MTEREQIIRYIREMLAVDRQHMERTKSRDDEIYWSGSCGALEAIALRIERGELTSAQSGKGGGCE